MIIGKNNNPRQNNLTSNFQNKLNQVEQNQQRIKGIVTNHTDVNQYTDVTNRNAMADKSLSMLQDRLDKGLISLEDFNRKCQAIAKQRKQ